MTANCDRTPADGLAVVHTCGLQAPAWFALGATARHGSVLVGQDYAKVGAGAE